MRDRSPKKGMLPAWPAFLIALAVCALPFALLPPLLRYVPEYALEAGLVLLLWLICPVLSLLVPAWAARRGVPALAACVLPTLGYLLVWCYHMAPVAAVLAGSLVVAVVSASFGQERRKRAEGGDRRK